MRFYLEQEKKKRSEYDEIFNHYQKKRVGFIKRDAKKCFKFYTSEPGIYKLLNVALKSLTDPRDLSRIRLPYL